MWCEETQNVCIKLSLWVQRSGPHICDAHLCELAPPDATLSPSVAAEANDREDPEGAEHRLTAGERKSGVTGSESNALCIDALKVQFLTSRTGRFSSMQWFRAWPPVSWAWFGDALLLKKLFLLPAQVLLFDQLPTSLFFLFTHAVFLGFSPDTNKHKRHQIEKSSPIYSLDPAWLIPGFISFELWLHLQLLLAYPCLFGLTLLFKKERRPLLSQLVLCFLIILHTGSESRGNGFHTKQTKILTRQQETSFIFILQSFY